MKKLRYHSLRTTAPLSPTCSCSLSIWPLLTIKPHRLFMDFMWHHWGQLTCTVIWIHTHWLQITLNGISSIKNKLLHHTRVGKTVQNCVLFSILGFKFTTMRLCLQCVSMVTVLNVMSLKTVNWSEAWQYCGRSNQKPNSWVEEVTKNIQFLKIKN